MRLLKFILILLVVGALGLVGYAYFGDLSPTQEDQNIPVELNAG